jgi:Icc protein
MRIVQMSDVHVGSGLFRQDLLEATIEESNAMEPDLVAIVGDLTMEGYRWEFEEAKEYFDRLECPNVIYAMGNHDAKNVGYRHFEEFFGIRERSAQIPVPEGEAKVVSLAVPGTGRDVNNLRDAGDVMAILRELKIDMVLSGHRHVPYVWSISGVRIVHSGTVSTMRVRGTMPPSYNVIEIDEQSVSITLHQPGKGEEGKEPLASFSRTPVTTSEFYPAFERFVLYDRLPFLSASADKPPWEGEPPDPDTGG